MIVESRPAAGRRRRALMLALLTLLAMAPEPALAAEVFFPSDCLHAPDALLVSADTQSYPGFVALRAAVFSNLAPCSSLPAAIGGVADEYFSGQVDFELSTDGGANWMVAHAPVTFQLHFRHTGPDGPDTRRFDTEVLFLDLSGGTLPYTLGFRESPTRVSTGVTTLRGVTGGYMIDSFFDVFTEMSQDGSIWYPSQQYAHLTLSSEHETATRSSTWGAIKTIYR